MKYLNNLFIALLLYSSLSITGQKYTFPLKTYSENLEAFEGVWEYKNVNDVFRIILIKGSRNTKLFTGETIVGDYFYQKDGSVLDNYSKSKITSEITDLNFYDVVIQATNGKSNAKDINPNKLHMILRDKRFEKASANCEIILISPTQIRWILQDSEGPVDEDFVSGFSIPTDVILTRVQ